MQFIPYLLEFLSIVIKIFFKKLVIVFYVYFPVDIKTCLTIEPFFLAIDYYTYHIIL